MQDLFFFFEVNDAEVESLNERIIVKVGEIDKKTVRLLTHLDVSADEIEKTLLKIAYVANEYEKVELGQ
jgi:hypothetical protein